MLALAVGDGSSTDGAELASKASAKERCHTALVQPATATACHAWEPEWRLACSAAYRSAASVISSVGTVRLPPALVVSRER